MTATLNGHVFDSAADVLRLVGSFEDAAVFWMNEGTNVPSPASPNPTSHPRRVHDISLPSRGSVDFERQIIIWLLDLRRHSFNRLRVC